VASSDICRAMAAALVLLSSLLPTSSATAAESGWHKQTTGTLAQLRAVFFLDQNVGWAAGGRGAFLHTEDGGITWKIEKRPSDDTIRDLVFWNQQDGWLLCDRNIFLMKSLSEARSYLLHTTDGGANWERIDVDGNDNDARFTRMVVTSDDRIWLLGEAGTLYMSGDRGRTWKKQVAPSRYLLLGGAFADVTHGWLVGGGTTIGRTVDGGATWRTVIVRNAPDARFESIAFANVNRGWVVGNGGRIFTTGDSGRSWTRQESGTDADLSDVHFLDQSEGWVIGSEGTILHTRDGGSHWSAVTSDTTHPLQRLIILDRTHGWAVGFGGTILSLSAASLAKPPVLRGGS
jgi:photosystem II stability/assembly factor-like uncharacterized protein